MTWTITHKPAYDTDFIELNKSLQHAAVRALQELEQDPITLRGDTIKPLKGWENVWRYRLGDYRLIYAVNPPSQMVQLLAIGPRASIYERFNYQGWDLPEASAEFGPLLAGQPEWMGHPEWFSPKKERPPELAPEPLPRRLTPTLLSKWRIDAAYHDVLVRCRTEDELYNLSQEQVPADVLSRVIDGLYPPEAERIASQPDQVLFRPEDLLRYAEGTLTGFLLRLDETQKPLTDWALAGPTLVKGGPGSGKSTVALYRVRAIIEHCRSEGGTPPTILFTTYTNALAHASESLLRYLLAGDATAEQTVPLPAGIQVSTLHRLALSIARKGGHNQKVADDRDCHDALSAARLALASQGSGQLAALRFSRLLQDYRDEYLLQEFDWVIEGQNCRNEADYLAAHRSGRGLPFNQEVRQAVWQLYLRFRQLLHQRRLVTWVQLLQLALTVVRSGKYGRAWDYVLVDEAQDLPPTGLALCVELCREPSGLFLTADANQSLYNRGFSWRRVHEALNVTGRTRILRRNYRNTREIAAAADEIIRNDDTVDREAAQQEYVHAGAYPVLYAAADFRDQAHWIGRAIYDATRELRLPVNAAAVLVPSSSVGNPLALVLQEMGLPARFMNSREFRLEEPAIKVTTLHAAKGLEFPIVAVAHVEAGRLPRETDATDPEELSTFLQEQRRLFYVGCTRAMRYLFVSYDASLPSPFLRPLSDDRWMVLSAES